MSHGAPNATKRVKERVINVMRNSEYIFVVFSGEARIIKGSNQSVRRISGVPSESVRKIEDIGVILLRSGMAVKAIIREVVRVLAVL